MNKESVKQKIAILLFPMLKIYNFFQAKKYDASISNTMDSLKVLAESNFSISRFGDGEFDLISGKELKFQKSDSELSRRLKEILEIKEQHQNVKIAIPCVYKYLNEFNKKSQIFWIMYFRKNRKSIFSLLNKKYQYLDSQITRIYINRKNKKQSEIYFNLWKKIWNDKDLLIVEGEKNRFGVGNDLLGNTRSIKRILCPPENSFQKYNEIFDAIKNNASGRLVLLILGPTATVLSYDLSALGIRALDIGNLDMEYEWFLRNVSQRVKIEGKYSIEVAGGTDVKANENAEYVSQILCVIK